MAPSDTESKKVSRKPANTAFRQQRLRAWQPILTPKTVLPVFFAIGAIFIPIGIGLYIAADRVQQVMFDYTTCDKSNAPANMAWSAATNTCTITFTIDKPFVKPVFLYYRLTSFYQNHRRYVKSYDSSQLRGDVVTASSLSDTCSPIKQPANSSNVQYYPCGLIANSMFSDNILDPVRTSDSYTYVFTEKGISWPSDASKYRTSKLFSEKTDQEIRTSILPPPAWRTGFKWKGYDQGYNKTNFPDLATWERFQVWMRTAGLPNFRKLWGRNDSEDMPAGTYTIQIQSNFEVARFGGTKSVVISTVSLIGGKNTFLGVAYIVVGVVCWAFGLAFLARHLIRPRKLGDHTYLSWNRQASQPQSAPVVGGGQGYATAVSSQGVSGAGVSQRQAGYGGQAVQMQALDGKS
ncbi:Lem3/Cdc50 [Gonapodya prolifera JEL478]|uniref:Lem3/Cdc50 n=1 Tax=Gonapodya prolifera (strain JEL478) TaxID=1344416 RepID=A0A139AT71_GONPJ|nr:Lem3/Cdc50 [Gonapodya prolifera JEL478]|eukprot:KXS19927.1 Lem3/Cdc50 [Gonapodya prolifera JEL478]